MGLPGTCAGATLIEVLVTLSILSLGLTGLSAMQLAALEHLRSVVQASRAASLAADMAERLHGASGGEPDDSETVAWRESVGANLPAGAAAVCIDSTPNDGVAGAPACDSAGMEWVIKVWWDEDGDGQAERRDITVLRP